MSGSDSSSYFKSSDMHISGYDSFEDDETVIVHRVSTNADGALLLDAASPAPTHDTITSLSPVPSKFSLGSPVRQVPQTFGPKRQRWPSLSNTRESRVLQQPVPYSPIRESNATKTVPCEAQDSSQAVEQQINPHHIKTTDHPKSSVNPGPQLAAPVSMGNQVAERNPSSVFPPIRVLNPGSWRRLVHSEHGLGGSGNSFTKWLPFGKDDRGHDVQSEQQAPEANHAGGTALHPNAALLQSHNHEQHNRENVMLLRRVHPRQSRETVRTYTHKPPFGQHEQTLRWSEAPLKEEFEPVTPETSALDLPAVQSPNRDHRDSCTCRATDPEQGMLETNTGPKKIRYIVDNTDNRYHELDPSIHEVKAGEAIPSAIARRAKAPRRFRDNRHWIRDRSKKQKLCMLITAIMMTLTMAMIVGFVISDQARNAYQQEIEQESDWP